MLRRVEEMPSRQVALFVLHTGSIKAFLVTDRVTTDTGREPLTASAPLVRAFVKLMLIQQVT